MLKTITKIVLLSLSFFVCLLSPKAQANCSVGANTGLMDQAFIRYLTQLAPSKDDRIALLPFTDLQTVVAEPLLASGLPFLIYDMFSTANPQMLHPYVSQALLQGMGIDPAKGDLTQLKTLAEKLEARFLVYGSIQSFFPNQIHVIVHVYDRKTDVTTSPPAEFKTDLNDSFFSLVREAVQSSFAASKEKIKSSNFKDPSLQAFLFYVRGMELSKSYDAKSLEMASLWLEKALKENYHNYDDAALNLARVHFMLALIQKLNKTDFSQNIMRANGFLAHLKDNDEKAPKVQETKRFLWANSAFISAFTALRNNQMPLANKEAAKVLTLTPEDGLAEQIYATSASGGGSLGKFALTNPVCL